jgi:hypothetical protein
MGPVAAQTMMTATAVPNVMGWPAPAEVLVAHQLKKRRMRP